MTRNASPLRFLVKQIFWFFYKPRNVFDWIAVEGGRLWVLPLLLITTVPESFWQKAWRFVLGLLGLDSSSPATQPVSIMSPSQMPVSPSG